MWIPLLLEFYSLALPEHGGFYFHLWLEQPHLPSTSDSWFSILALSILCSAIGFIGQTAAQKYTTPTHTGLIFSLEPIFAAFLAFIFVEEVLPARGYLGAALVLFGVLTAKIDFKKSFMSKGIRKTINESEPSFISCKNRIESMHFNWFVFIEIV